MKVRDATLHSRGTTDQNDPCMFQTVKRDWGKPHVSIFALNCQPGASKVMCDRANKRLTNELQYETWRVKYFFCRAGELSDLPVTKLQRPGGDDLIQVMISPGKNAKAISTPWPADIGSLLTSTLNVQDDFRWQKLEIPEQWFTAKSANSAEETVAGYLAHFSCDIERSRRTNGYESFVSLVYVDKLDPTLFLDNIDAFVDFKSKFPFAETLHFEICSAEEMRDALKQVSDSNPWSQPRGVTAQTDAPVYMVIAPRGYATVATVNIEDYSKLLAYVGLLRDFLGYQRPSEECHLVWMLEGGCRCPVETINDRLVNSPKDEPMIVIICANADECQSMEEKALEEIDRSQYDLFVYVCSRELGAKIIIDTKQAGNWVLLAPGDLADNLVDSRTGNINKLVDFVNSDRKENCRDSWHTSTCAKS